MQQNNLGVSKNMAYGSLVKKGYIRESEYQLPDINAPKINYEMLNFEEPKRPSKLKAHAHDTIIAMGELIKHNQTILYKEEKEKLIKETKESIEADFLQKTKNDIKKAIKISQAEHKKKLIVLEEERKKQLQEELKKSEEKLKLRFKSKLEEQKIELENLAIDNVKKIKLDWIKQKNKEIEIVINKEKDKYAILEDNLIRTMREDHIKEITTAKEERRIAFLKLKDTLLKDHAIHIKEVSLKYEKEYKTELSNKRDFYEQQMNVLRGRINDREDTVSDLREMITALSDENHSIKKETNSIRKAYYNFVKTTMTCDNATEFLFDGSFENKIATSDQLADASDSDLNLDKVTND